MARCTGIFPVIAKWAGFVKIGEQVVEHRPRKYGKTKFGVSRFVNGLLDLMSIFLRWEIRQATDAFFWNYGCVEFFSRNNYHHMDNDRKNLQPGTSYKTEATN